MLQNRRQEAVHLLRRAGFGPKSYDEINRLAALTHPQAVAQLLNFNPEVTALQFDLAARLTARQPSPEEWGQSDLQQAWLEVMLETNYPLQEKMALFWHGHFTSSINKVGDGRLMLNQNHYFRRQALGNFGEMLRDLSHDPAMLIYLDGLDNSRENPNENFARELMELFSLGPGNYTEQDIREAARAFTGWSYQYSENDESDPPQIIFDPDLHDQNLKTFMGQSGYFDGNAIISIILQKRQAAYFITRKLWEYLVYPSPTQELVMQLGDLFFDSGYDIHKLVEAILLHPEFLSPRAYRALVKSPVELVAGSLRVLGASQVESDNLYLMGQSLFAPPNVKGWPGGRRWINSATFLARVNFLGELLEPAYEQPNQSMPLLKAYRNVPASTAFNIVAELLVDQQASGLDRIEHFFETPFTGTGETDDDPDQQQQESDAHWRGMVHLLMSCPEYQLN